jgi:hypothetical protein
MNKHATMRLARDPAHLTDQELAADAICSLENRYRSLIQSRKTVAGARAEPMPRDRIRRAMRLLIPCPLRSQSVR